MATWSTSLQPCRVGIWLKQAHQPMPTTPIRAPMSVLRLGNGRLIDVLHMRLGCCSGGIGIARTQSVQQTAMVAQGLLQHAGAFRSAFAKLQPQHVQAFADALQKGVVRSDPDDFMEGIIRFAKGNRVADGFMLFGQQGLKPVQIGVADIDRRPPRHIAFDQGSRVVKLADIHILQRQVELDRSQQRIRSQIADIGATALAGADHAQHPHPPHPRPPIPATDSRTMGASNSMDVTGSLMPMPPLVPWRGSAGYAGPRPRQSAASRSPPSGYAP